MKLFTRTDTETTKDTIRLFVEAIGRDKPRLLWATTLITLSTVAYTVLIPLFLSLIIQTLIAHPNDISKSYPWIAAIIAASAITIIFNDRGFRWLFHNQEIVHTYLIQKSVNHLLLRSHSFFANHKVGSLTGEVISLGRSYMTITDALILQTLGVLVNFVASLIIIAFLSPLLLIPLIALTTGIVFMGLRSLTKRSALRNERKRLMSLLTGSVSDILGNSLLVRIFARSEQETESIMRERTTIEKLTLKEVNIIQTEADYRFVTLFTFQIATILLGLWLFAEGNITIAALVFTVTYLGRVTGSLFSITGSIRQLEQGFLDASPMTNILKESIEITDHENAKELVCTTGSIECRSISFTYGDNKNEHVFSNLDLTIPAGQRIGLAGHSGGGKTTLTQLLLRFSDLDSGEILIDQQAITNVTQNSLHNAISYVPQDPYLFHRTLRENIAYGRPMATDDEIVEAAHKAHAMEFIRKLPEGLDTIVGERGVKLSGGQRQRIAIARAILKDAPILILDEATSALDSESEQLIQKALETLMQNRTSIVIAHRLSTIAKLDRIIVLNNGSIVEDGTHRELIARGGTYASLWNHQSGGFIEE